MGLNDKSQIDIKLILIKMVVSISFIKCKL